MKYLDVEGVGRVSRIGLGTWQFGSREWGYGDQYAEGAARDIVALNAGAAIYVADKAPTLEDGVEIAFETIKSGAARAKLDEFARVTRQFAK